MYFVIRQFDPRREQSLRIEAKRGRLHFREALQDEAGRAEEQQRQRDLDDHEPITAASRGFRFRTSERTGLEGGFGYRSRAACHAGQSPNKIVVSAASEKGECQDAPVEADSFETRRAGRRESDERVASPDGENQTKRAADDRDDKAFDQKLPNDLAARSAHRRANRKLPSACGPARGQEIRQVRAGDEQNEGNRAEQQRQTGPVIAEQIIEERLDRGADAGIGRRINFLDARRRSPFISLRACSTVTPSFSRPQPKNMG